VFRDKWIVTAAHCQVYERYEVVVGREDLRTSGGEVHQVGWSTIKVHPSYDEPIRFDFDVALIELPGPAGVPSVALLGNVWETAGEATTIGWGRTFEGGPASPILLKVRVPLVSDATCRQHYPGLTPQMLCADTVGLGSCQGDSGGALLFGGQLAGIVSYGRGCAGEAPGVYAQIQSEVGDWIDRCAR
jgi:secreted trypsin-like serine protease